MVAMGADVVGESESEIDVGEGAEAVAAVGVVVAEAAAPAVPEPPEPEWRIPDMIGCSKVRFVEGHDTHHGRGYHARLAIRCPHKRCLKSRSLRLDSAKWGRSGAVYWLGAWLTKGADLSEEEHAALGPIAYKPTDEEIARYRDSIA